MICYLGRAQFQFSGWFICEHINITKREPTTLLVSSSRALSLSLFVCLHGEHTRLIFHFNGAFLIKKMQITPPVQIARFGVLLRTTMAFCILTAPASCRRPDAQKNPIVNYVHGCILVDTTLFPTAHSQTIVFVSVPPADHLLKSKRG
jgi:hypothetical protein